MKTRNRLKVDNFLVGALKNSTLLIFVLGVLSSCSFRPDSNPESGGTTAKNDVQDRERLKTSFAPVTGLYQGKIITLTNQEIPVEMGFFIVQELVGKNSRGESKLLPSLKMRFRRKDQVSPYRIADVSYTPDTGELITTMFRNNGDLSSSSSANSNSGGTKAASVADPFSTTGVFQGQSYKGDITTNTGLLGRFELTQTGEEVVTSPSGESNEYKEALRSKLQFLAGKYLAKFKSDDGSKELTWELEIRVLEGGTADRPSPVVTVRDPATGSVLGALAQGEYLPENNLSFRFSNSLLIFDGRMESESPQSGFSGQLKGPNLSGSLIAKKILVR